MRLLIYTNITESVFFLNLFSFFDIYFTRFCVTSRDFAWQPLARRALPRRSPCTSARTSPTQTHAHARARSFPLTRWFSRLSDGAMWIQIRTIDGKETRTVEDLSRLTKIESLRVKINEIFNVKPEQQRLFYRGKQVRAPRSVSCSHCATVRSRSGFSQKPSLVLRWVCVRARACLNVVTALPRKTWNDSSCLNCVRIILWQQLFKVIVWFCLFNVCVFSSEAFLQCVK